MTRQDTPSFGPASATEVPARRGDAAVSHRRRLISKELRRREVLQLSPVHRAFSRADLTEHPPAGRPSDLRRSRKGFGYTKLEDGSCEDGG